MKKLLLVLLIGMFTIAGIAQQIAFKNIPLERRGDKFAIFYLSFDKKDKCFVSFKIQNIKNFKQSFYYRVEVNKNEVYHGYVELEANSSEKNSSAFYACNIGKHKIKILVDDYKASKEISN